MPMSILFWVVYVVALIFVGYSGRGDIPGTGRSLVFFILVGLLGWKVFGGVIQ